MHWQLSAWTQLVFVPEDHLALWAVEMAHYDLAVILLIRAADHYSSSISP